MSRNFICYNYSIPRVLIRQFFSKMIRYYLVTDFVVNILFLLQNLLEVKMLYCQKFCGIALPYL